MFDDFVVKEAQEEDVSWAEIDNETTEEDSAIDGKKEDQSQEEEVSEVIAEDFKEIEENENQKEEDKSDTEQKAYSQEELDTAVKQASEESYNRGIEDSKKHLNNRIIQLLEEIGNKLTLIFDESKKEDLRKEKNTLDMALSVVRKLFPTLEKEKAEEEIKNFLQKTFNNFSSQGMLSFAFHPDSISLVAESLEKLARQYDFEGKISVHKDSTLGISDCRVEWKNGGVERKASAILEKIENLTDNNEQERENG